MWQEELIRITATKKFAVAAGSVLTGAASSLITWQIARKHFVEKFEEELKVEIDAAKRLYKVEEYADPPGYEPRGYEMAVRVDDGFTEASEEVLETLEHYKAGKAITVEVPAETEDVLIAVQQTEHEGFATETSSIFDDVEPSHVEITEEMIAARGVVEPYVLTDDEFYMNEPENKQLDLTWYEEDEVLADEQDRPIVNPDRIVGINNLRTNFGVGSGRQNLMFIRNPRLGTDYEISRSNGSFAKEVHDVKLHHSDDFGRRRPRRMRETDE